MAKLSVQAGMKRKLSSTPKTAVLAGSKNKPDAWRVSASKGDFTYFMGLPYQLEKAYTAGFSDMEYVQQSGKRRVARSGGAIDTVPDLGPKSSQTLYI